MSFFSKKPKNRAEAMLDMHCHILPGVDDGASTFEEAIEMLKLSEAEGITHIVCTPHYKAHRKSVRGEKLEEAFQEFCRKVQQSGCNINLYLGNEVFYFQDLERAVEAGKVHSMNDSSYMLVEFHPQDSYQTIQNGLYDVSSLGYTPILAHAERCKCLYKKPSYIEDLHRGGIRIQVNASTITGDQGIAMKQFAAGLLKRQVVDYVATDAHSTGSRAPRMAKCRELLYKKYDSHYVDGILFKNAMRDFLEES